MKSSIKWIKHCKTQEEKKQVMAQVLAAKPALDILKKIILEEINTTKRNAGNKARYEDPSWAYYQADSLGEARAYQVLLKLLTNEEI